MVGVLETKPSRPGAKPVFHHEEVTSSLQAVQRDYFTAANWPNVHFLRVWEEFRPKSLSSRLHTETDAQITTVNNQQLIGRLMGSCSRAEPRPLNRLDYKPACWLAELTSIHILSFSIRMDICIMKCYINYFLQKVQVERETFVKGRNCFVLTNDPHMFNDNQYIYQ